MQNTILHIIDSLGIGGAETLLKGTIPALKDYRHVIVYLYASAESEKELANYPKICLNFNGKVDFIKSVLRLRKIIKECKATLVHSHLYWGTMLSRFALPKGVSLVSSYHSLLYDPLNKAQYSYKMLLLDKFSYKKRYHSIFVSEVVKNLITKKIGIKENFSILYNYIEDNFFHRCVDIRAPKKGKLKVVALGNLRPEKNYPWLIKSFSQLPANKAELHIYGTGKQEEILKEIIRQQANHNVFLKGRTDEASCVLREYDLFLSGSKFEGFGIAVAEAMAAGLPCLLSGLPAHREVAGDKALYFNPDDSNTLVKQLLSFIENRDDLVAMSKKSRERAIRFRKSSYLAQLENIYQKQIKS